MSAPRPSLDNNPAADRPDTETLLRRLTGNLAHNLNNRLMGVIGSLELSLEDAPSGSPLSDHLRVGLDCALQAAEMVRRMVAFACRTSTELDTTLTDLGEVASNTARRMRERNLAAMTVAVSVAPSPLVRVNPLLFQLALDQLVNNAVEAMPAGGKLTLHLESEHDEVRLRVSDTGPGLTPAVASHLYEPFVTTKTAGHLGLGLALCRDLTEALGGRLDLVWEYGEGTTATLIFPAGSEPPREHNGNLHSAVEARPSSSGPMWHVI